MWSAACGQAAEDLEFFVYRAVDVRRRWSCACLLVLFCRCVAPDHALCLVSVLSAYSLQASCVVVASGGPRWRRRAALGAKNLGELRALSRRHATSLSLSRSFARLAARAALQQPWCVLRALAATGDKKASFLGTDPRRQCFGLEHLR